MSIGFKNQKGLALSSSKGFTLIEVVAVIGVLAVTSAVLIVNNRLNELQLSLSKDSALIASTVSRAKSLALQNSAATGGYGVRFKLKGTDNEDNFFIFKDDKFSPESNSINTDDEVPGSRTNLSSGVIFYNPGNNIVDSTGKKVLDYIIKDVVFYSSDANVKIFNSSGASLEAGIVIIQTDSATAASFNTLKITITGQVTSKTGLYISPYNFDKEIKSVMDDEGNIDDGPSGGVDDDDPEDPPPYDEPDPSCIADCTGKCGGPNICNGTCPNTCQTDYTCSSSFNSCIYTGGGGGGGCLSPANTCNDTVPDSNPAIKCVTCLVPNVCMPTNNTYNCVTLSSDKNITSYEFVLSSTMTATGIINENNPAGPSIAVTVPFGTNVNNLVATFVADGPVKIGTVPQVSEETSNNFNNPTKSLIYRVSAANGDTKDYIVTVTKALISDKDIKSYEFVLSSTMTATGIINENNPTGPSIAVTVPFGTNVNNLVATFTTTGTSVKIIAISQVSGETPNNFTNPKTYIVTDANTPPGTKNYTVTVSVLVCSAGQTKPYSVCSGGVCQSINGCGVTTCTANSCPIEEPLIIDSIDPPIFTK